MKSKKEALNFLQKGRKTNCDERVLLSDGEVTQRNGGDVYVVITI
jgi:hypothetical protein